MDVPRAGPVVMDAWHKGEEHMIDVAVVRDIWCPMGIVIAADGQFGSPDVLPIRAVGGFGDSDLGAMYPGDAGQISQCCTTVRVKHPPTILSPVPNDDRI